MSSSPCRGEAASLTGSDPVTLTQRRRTRLSLQQSQRGEALEISDKVDAGHDLETFSYEVEHVTIRTDHDDDSEPDEAQVNHLEPNKIVGRLVGFVPY